MLKTIKLKYFNQIPENYTGIVEFSNENKFWYLNGQLHCEDGPAIVCYNGDKEWWLNGKLHREAAPAVEYSSGYKEYRFEGKLHKEDGAAVEWSNGDKEYWYNGKMLNKDKIDFFIKNLDFPIKVAIKLVYREQIKKGISKNWIIICFG